MIDPYLAYCLDEAIYSWGIHVENEVEKAGQKGKKPKDQEKNRTRRLGELLKLAPQQRFKSFRQAAGKAPAKVER